MGIKQLHHLHIRKVPAFIIDHFANETAFVDESQGSQQIENCSMPCRFERLPLVHMSRFVEILARAWAFKGQKS